jgi:uncharacterized protein
VSFETALLVFDDPKAISRMEQIVDEEERWQTLGMVVGMVIVLVAHTFREKDDEEYVRIISARKATPRERKIYEETL